MKKKEKKENEFCFICGRKKHIQEQKNLLEKLESRAIPTILFEEMEKIFRKSLKNSVGRRFFFAKRHSPLPILAVLKKTEKKEKNKAEINICFYQKEKRYFLQKRRKKIFSFYEENSSQKSSEENISLEDLLGSDWKKIIGEIKHFSKKIFSVFQEELNNNLKEIEVSFALKNKKEKDFLDLSPIGLLVTEVNTISRE